MRIILIAAWAMITTTSCGWCATYNYRCTAPQGHHEYPAALDDVAHTLTWRGKTFHDLRFGELGHCHYNFATKNRDVKLCGATQGLADLTIAAKSFDCQQVVPR